MSSRGVQINGNHLRNVLCTAVWLRKHTMDDDAFNLEIRKYLKKVGITSQRIIEKKVREALESGELKGNERLEARVKLEVPALRLVETIDGKISLE